MFRPYGGRILDVAGLGLTGNTRILAGTTLPKSGTAGTFKNCAAGSLYFATTSRTFFVNEGSAGNPYWTPTNFNQRGLLAWASDFRDGVGKAHSDTAATATIGGSGLRIHGQGIAETDSGAVITMSDQGAICRLTTTDEDEHTVVMSVGNGTTPVYQPDQNGTIVVDAKVSHATAITLRGFFFGFGGSAADALDPMINGSTTTISFANTIADDIAGMCMDVGLTDADGIFCVTDKGNANASIATTATSVDPSVTVAAAGTYQRFRVEVDADGAVRMFVDKILKATFAAGTLDTDEEIHPILQIISESAAVVALDVQHFHTWGARV